RSEAFRRQTVYCTGSSICFHSSRVFEIFSTGTPPHLKKPHLCLFHGSGGTYDCASSERQSVTRVSRIQTHFDGVMLSGPHSARAAGRPFSGSITMQFSKSN